MFCRHDNAPYTLNSLDPWAPTLAADQDILQALVDTIHPLKVPRSRPHTASRLYEMRPSQVKRKLYKWYTMSKADNSRIEWSNFGRSLRLFCDTIMRFIILLRNMMSDIVIDDSHRSCDAWLRFALRDAGWMVDQRTTTWPNAPVSCQTGRKPSICTLKVQHPRIHLLRNIWPRVQGTEPRWGWYNTRNQEVQTRQRRRCDHIHWDQSECDSRNCSTCIVESAWSEAHM